MNAPTKPHVSLLAALRAAPSTVPFPSLDQLKEMLGILAGDTSQDEAITFTMAAAINEIEDWLGRGIQEFTGIEPHEPVETRNSKLKLRHFPVTEVRSVLVDGAPVTGWRVFPNCGILELGRGCGDFRYACQRDPLIDVEYTGGYPDDAWPPTLVDAALQVFGVKWNRTSGSGNAVDVAAGGPVKQVSVDGLSVSYGDLSGGSSSYDGGPIPPDLAGVYALLEPYRDRLVTGV